MPDGLRAVFVRHSLPYWYLRITFRGFTPKVAPTPATLPLVSAPDFMSGG